MKYPLVLVFWSALLFTACQQQKKLPVTLQLPLEIKDGYGPFQPGFGELTPESDDYPKSVPNRTSRLPIKGIPKTWVNTVKIRIDLQPYQFIYQNFCAGNIDTAWFNGFQSYWKWTPDERAFSASPIRCFVYAIKGFDTVADEWAVMVDTNNNLDFSDETAVYPEVIRDGAIPDEIRKPLRVEYEVYQHGKVRKAQTLMSIRRKGELFLYNFPHHAVATDPGGNTNRRIFVSSGFSHLDFTLPDLALPASVNRTGKVDPQELISLGEIIELEGVAYRNKGVDFARNVLRLERADLATQTFTLQPGQPFWPFEAREFTTGKSVALADFRGKYVYIDFWATWCKGCVEDMPALKEVYRSLDKNRFAFLGVVSADKPERVRAFLRKRAVEWPQIFSDSTDKITQTYGIRTLPVTVLLDPDGNVLAKDLRGAALSEKLRELAAR
ncbi:peroxiredoxin family protein [Larkinella insperata]|uniref:Peroxiredoxin family protein n=1 Tax=Larkinella insperata TaxID=332158 RepID=A0ABW3PZ28_9BACT|nr:TlpA disulfide reductase family protein [Larkinella insperata]